MTDFNINETLRVNKHYNPYTENYSYIIQKYEMKYSYPSGACVGYQWQDIYNIGNLDDVKKLKEVCEKILDNAEGE